jgi:trimeric autotransporter adhesin
MLQLNTADSACTSAACEKKEAQPWRVPDGISALGDRTTFMPARKKSAPGGCHNLESKIMKNINALRDSGNRSFWRRGSVFIPLGLVALLAVSPTSRAVTPPPDGGYFNDNTAEGEDALFSLTTGFGNTAAGSQALFSNTTGSFNTATGEGALFSNGTGNNNTATGSFALLYNTTGDGNTANGNFALFSNTEGSNNTANGVRALLSNREGSSNTANGVSALLSNTTGGFNTANGVQALNSNTEGNGNTASGVEALNYNTTGDTNTANGYRALYGDSRSPSTGSNNTANGAYALNKNITGYFNAANGESALFNNTTGYDNTANGARALVNNTIGLKNTADGAFALYSNTTGNSNIALGFLAGTNLTTGDNNIDIGNEGVAGESNTIRIGTVGTRGTHTNAYIAGIYQATVAKSLPVVVDSTGHLGTKGSSERFKDAIKPMDKASEALHALKPVTFHYKKELDPEGTPQFGLIAEEVAAVNPDLVVREENGEIYTVRYEAVNAMLLNEFLKEHRAVQELKSTATKQEATIAQQQKGMEALAAHLKEQDSKIQKVSAQIEVSKPAPQTVLNNQ